MKNTRLNYEKRRTVLKTIGTGLVGGVALTGNVTANRGGLKRELAEVRSATARYNNPANAYAAGYTALDENGNPVALEDVVDEAEAVCEMGFHFVLGFPPLGGDRLDPPVLVYGVDEDDNLILGAVEWVVPYTEENPNPPDLFEHDDGAEQWDKDEPFPGVFSLHAWVHNHNPNGVFNHHNPRKQFSPPGCHGH